MRDLLKAKVELREIIISEYGQDYYYDMLTERTRFIHEVKEKSNFLFGEDDSDFREHLRFVVANQEHESEDAMLEEFLLMDMALDTLM